MADYAQTRIKYSDPKDPNAEILEFEQGEEVSGIDDDSLKILRESGAVMETAPLPDDQQAIRAALAEKDAEIAELKARLGVTEDADADEEDTAPAPAKAAPAPAKEASKSASTDK